MNAAAQLSMFEPEAADATALLLQYMRAANAEADRVERFALLQMHGAAAQAQRAMEAAVQNANAMAFYLDLLEASGEGA